METLQAAVVEWRRKFNLPVNDTVRALPKEIAEAHIELIREEFEKELVPALLEGDIVEVYDAGLDVIVYLVGLLSDAGYDLEPGLTEVMRGNYSKLDPATGEPIYSRGQEIDGAPLGKVMKGSAYVPPNLKDIVESGAADIAFGEEFYGPATPDLADLSDDDLPGAWSRSDFL